MGFTSEKMDPDQIFEHAHRELCSYVPSNKPRCSDFLESFTQQRDRFSKIIYRIFGGPPASKVTQVMQTEVGRSEVFQHSVFDRFNFLCSKATEV